HLVCCKQRLLGPGSPDMRDVQDDKRNVGEGDIEHPLKGILFQIIRWLQGSRSRQDMEMILAFRQQTLQQHIVETAAVFQRFLDAVIGVYIEAETGGSERQIEIGQDDVAAASSRDRRSDMLGDGRGSYASVGSDKRKRARE